MPAEALLDGVECSFNRINGAVSVRGELVLVCSRCGDGLCRADVEAEALPTFAVSASDLLAKTLTPDEKRVLCARFSSACGELEVTFDETESVMSASARKDSTGVSYRGVTVEAIVARTVWWRPQDGPTHVAEDTGRLRVDAEKPLAEFAVWE